MPRHLLALPSVVQQKQRHSEDKQEDDALGIHGALGKLREPGRIHPDARGDIAEHASRPANRREPPRTGAPPPWRTPSKTARTGKTAGRVARQRSGSSGSRRQGIATSSYGRQGFNDFRTQVPRRIRVETWTHSHHDVQSYQLVLCPPELLSNPPLAAISVNRANRRLAPDHDSKPSELAAIRLRKRLHEARSLGHGRAKNGTISLSAGKTLNSRETRQWSSLHRESSSPLRAAGANNGSPAPSTHAHEESMRTLASNLRRMIGALHSNRPCG